MEGLLRTKAAQKALQKVQRVAKMLEPLFDDNRAIEKNYEQLRKILDEQLKHDEYLVIVDEDGMSYVHTNRLREGNPFKDKVGLKAAKTNEPLLQVYPRNTGEVLIDASTPIVNANGVKFNLRLGRIVRKKFLGPMITAIIVLPTAFVGILGLILSIPLGKLIPLVLVSLIILAILGTYMYRYIMSGILNWYYTMRKISAGDLTAEVTNKSRTEFHQIGFEINKVVLGMKNIIEEIDKSAHLIDKVSEEQAQEANQLSKTFKELSETMQNFKTGTENQLASLQNAHAMVQEMMSSVRKIQSDIRYTVEISEEASVVAEEGTEAVNLSEDKMLQIQDTVYRSSKEIMEVAEDANNVINKVSAITQIAEQTNLLALNASIEAARAGDAGKGFAIVADEVRKLAEDTNTFASDIISSLEATRDKMKEAVKQVESNVDLIKDGVTVVKIAGEAIRKLNDVSDQTKQAVLSNESFVNTFIKDGEQLEIIIDKINVIADQFTEQVIDTVASVDEQVSGVQRLADDATELASQSEKLTKIVKRFKLN